MHVRCIILLYKVIENTSVKDTRVSVERICSRQSPLLGAMQNACCMKLKYQWSESPQAVSAIKFGTMQKESNCMLDVYYKGVPQDTNGDDYDAKGTQSRGNIK